MSTKVHIDPAANIAGWMTYRELEWLAKQAKRHYNIVEIGSFMGRSTRALADNTPGRVFAIDDFAGPRDKSLPSALADNLLEIFNGNLIDLIRAKKVITVVADHRQLVIDTVPDMVFIDGSHDYTDVKYDIELWLSKISKGGLICGHDFTNIPDVHQAVIETIAKPKVAKGTSIWYARTK